MPADVGHDVVKGGAAHVQDIVEITAGLQHGFEVHGKTGVGEVVRLHQEGLLGVLNLGKTLCLGFDECPVGQAQLEVHPDPGQDLGLFKGLGNEVHPADLQAANLAGSIRQGRDEDDGNVRRSGIVLEQFAGCVPVFTGHEHVEQDEVGLAFQGESARFGAACGRDGSVAPLFEHDVEELDVQGLVVDDEDAGCGVFHGVRPGMRVYGMSAG